MSTSAVSSSSIYQELQSFYQNRHSDLQQLGSALQSGDLNDAQQAYNALASLGQSGPFASSEPFSKSSKGQAFEAIGQALQSGDLAGAQTAFAKLTGNQSSSSSSSQTTPATVVTLSDTQPDTATASATTATATTDTTSIYQQLSAYRQERRSDVAQLGQDLQAGNLSAAQTDFNALTTLGQSGPNANGQPFQNSTRAQDFQAIGQALQSGDLADAQSAFATLAATFGGQGPRGHAVGPTPVVPPISVPPSTATGSGGDEIVINLGSASSASSSSGSTTPEIVINLGQGSGSPSTSPEEITINLGSGSSGGQITIDENQAQSGSSSSAQQLTINLNQQSNYELILNLLNSTATGQTTSGSSSALNVQA